VGGANASDVSYATAELYDPASGQFTALTGVLHDARQFPNVVALSDGRVLITGGRINATTWSSTAELFTLSNGTFAVSAGTPVATRAFGFQFLLPTGKVLLGGGSQSSGAPQGSAELYDPLTDSFVATGSVVTPRYQAAVAQLVSGEVFVAGGMTTVPSTVAYSSAEIFW
jgi:hypothetical protein